MVNILKMTQPLPNATRCETRGCGAQAWVEVEFVGGSRLFFCAHDYGKRKDALAESALRILDHRDALNRMEQQA